MGGNNGLGEKRNSFIVYADGPLLERDETGGYVLSREERGDIVTWAGEYVTDGAEPALDGEPPRVVMAWGGVRNALIVNGRKYRETCEKNRDNANARWERERARNATASNHASDATASNDANDANHANRADTGTYTVTDTDTDSGKATSSNLVSSTCNVTLSSRDVRALQSSHGEETIIHCPNCQAQMWGRYEEATGRCVAQCMNCGWSTQ